MYHISFIVALVALAAGFQNTLTPEERATQLVHSHCQGLHIINGESELQRFMYGELIPTTVGILVGDCDKRVSGSRWEKQRTMLNLDTCLGWNYTRPGSLMGKIKYIKSLLFVIISKRSSSFLSFAICNN